MTYRSWDTQTRVQLLRAENSISNSVMCLRSGEEGSHPEGSAQVGFSSAIANVARLYVLIQLVDQPQFPDKRIGS